MSTADSPIDVEDSDEPEPLCQERYDALMSQLVESKQVLTYDASDDAWRYWPWPIKKGGGLFQRISLKAALEKGDIPTPRCLCLKMEEGRLLGSLTTFYMPKPDPDDFHDVVRLRCDLGQCRYDVDLGGLREEIECKNVEGLIHIRQTYGKQMYHVFASGHYVPGARPPNTSSAAARKTGASSWARRATPKPSLRSRPRGIGRTRGAGSSRRQSTPNSFNAGFASSGNKQQPFKMDSTPPLRNDYDDVTYSDEDFFKMSDDFDFAFASANGAGSTATQPAPKASSRSGTKHSQSFSPSTAPTSSLAPPHASSTTQRPPSPATTDNVLAFCRTEILPFLNSEEGIKRELFADIIRHCNGCNTFFTTPFFASHVCPSSRLLPAP